MATLLSLSSLTYIWDPYKYTMVQIKCASEIYTRLSQRNKRFIEVEILIIWVCDQKFQL